MSSYFRFLYRHKITENNHDSEFWRLQKKQRNVIF